MKSKYVTPTIEITKFHTEDIITSSSLDSDSSAAATISEEEIPQIMDAENLFKYNS